MDGDRDHGYNSAQAQENSVEENPCQMEGSFSSLTFKGPVNLAIRESVMSMKILFVYIEGADEVSNNLEQSTWRDAEVVKLLSEHCVVLHLPQGSAEALHFSAIYPHRSVPAMSAVGYNGVRLWYHEGYISAEGLITSIEKARTDLHCQEVVTANMIVAAIAARRQEPLSNAFFRNVAPPMHEEMTCNVEPSPSLGAIPLNQSSQTEEIEQIVVASGPDEQEDMVSATAMPVPDIPSRSSSTFSSEYGSIPKSTESSSSVVELPGNLSLRNQSIVDPAHKQVYSEMSVDVAAFNLGNMNSQTGDKVKSGHNKKNEGEKLEADVKSHGEQTRNVMSSDLGDPTLEIVPEVETSNHGSSPVMDDQSILKLPIRDLSFVHLQIRLLNGSSLQAKFAATDTLTRVKNYIIENRTDGNRDFSLAIPYPRKVFSEEDLEKMLLELNLGTRTAIILVPYKSTIGSFDRRSSPQANSMGAPSSPQNSEVGPGFFARILSYINPFSYFGGSSANQESTTRDSVWQYGPNLSIQNAFKEGQNNTHMPQSNIPGKGQKVGSSSKVQKRGWGSNIHTLKHDEDETFRDRNAFWNGNSTQYGGDDSKRD